MQPRLPISTVIAVVLSTALAALLVGCDSGKSRRAVKTSQISIEGAAAAELAAAIEAVAAGKTRTIELEDTPVYDGDLAPLAKLNSLEELKLPQAHLTDAGVGHLAGLVGLRVLVLGDTTIGDDGLQRIAELRQLRVLNLNRADVTSAGVAHLQPLDMLELLRFGESQIDDAGLAHLAKLPRLEALILQNAPITDAGLVHLKGMSGLKSLYIEGTRVTNDGVDELKKSLPRLHVHW